MTYQYRLAPQWWRCTDDDCGVMWDQPIEEPCWACGSTPRKTIQPYLTSQTGMVIHQPTLRAVT